MDPIEAEQEDIVGLSWPIEKLFVSSQQDITFFRIVHLCFLLSL